MTKLLPFTCLPPQDPSNSKTSFFIQYPVTKTFLQSGGRPVTRHRHVLLVLKKPPPEQFISPACLHVSTSNHFHLVLTSCRVQKTDFFLLQRNQILSNCFPVSSLTGTDVYKHTRICLASCLYKQV